MANKPPTNTKSIKGAINISRDKRITLIHNQVIDMRFAKNNTVPRTNKPGDRAIIKRKGLMNKEEITNENIIA